VTLQASKNSDLSLEATQQKRKPEYENMAKAKGLTRNGSWVRVREMVGVVQYVGIHHDYGFYN
jgi:hypothetical protein